MGRIYYFSSDALPGGDGTAERPFSALHEAERLSLGPGDEIRLRCGCVFYRQWLHLKNCRGAEGRPIVVGCYGEGPLPTICAEGTGLWYQDYGTTLDSPCHVYRGYVSSAVLLYDCAYIRLENLEITNAPKLLGERHGQGDGMDRTGVSVVAQNGGTLSEIVLTGLDIHDVRGNIYDKHLNNGGIYCAALKPERADAPPARYHRLRIERCRVTRCSRWGIAAGYSYAHGRFTGKEISNETAQRYGHTEMVVEHNLVKDIGGDGITVMYALRPLVQYNVSDRAAMEINDKDYTQAGQRGGKVAAAIWPWKCKDALFQYNEAYHTCPNQDGQAWDADSGDGTVYQYNYSFGNGGGAVMFCQEESVGNVFRYNVSVLDQGGAVNPVRNPDAHIYGNIFVMDPKVPFIRPGMAGGHMLVENNLIVNTGGEAEMDWHLQTPCARYRRNLYAGYRNVPKEDGEAAGCAMDRQRMLALALGGPRESRETVHAKEDFACYEQLWKEAGV